MELLAKERVCEMPVSDDCCADREAAVTLEKLCKLLDIVPKLPLRAVRDALLAS